MKRLIPILFILFLGTSAAFADAIDDGLGQNTSAQVRSSTKEMVKVGITENDAVSLTRTMVQHRYQERQILQVHKNIREAKHAGLPPEPLMNKLREGIAKQVPPERVAQAIEQTRERYAHAYGKAKNIAPDEEKVSSLGNVIAEGMAAGMRSADVDAIAQRLQDRTRTMARDQLHKLATESFMTARDMTRQGVSPATGSDVVCQALERSWQYRDMEKLRSSFMTRARLGDPQGLALRYSHAIRNGFDSSQIDSNQAQGISGQGARKGGGSLGGGQGTGQGGPSGDSGGAGSGGGSSSGGSGASGGGSGSSGSGSSGSGAGGGSGSGSGSGSGAGGSGGGSGSGGRGGQ